MEKNTSFFRIENLEKKYGSHSIFKNLHLELKEGSWLGIVGRNGCGKSTLARIIVGLENYSVGKIYLNGELKQTFTKKEWLHEVQLITQYTRRALDPTKNIKQILLEPLQKFKSGNPIYWQESIEKILMECGLKTNILSKTPLQLSGGQYQRVCLAAGLLIKPKIFICDEATANLDLINERRIVSLLKKCSHMSVIFISHDLERMNEICDEIIYIDDFK